MDWMKWIRAQWDRVGAVTAIAVGALALLIGWVQISGEVYPAAQLPYILSGGLGGLFLLGVGSTLWLSADLRDEWRELRRIRDELERHGSLFDTPKEVADPAPTNGSHAMRAPSEVDATS